MIQCPVRAQEVGSVPQRTPIIQQRIRGDVAPQKRPRRGIREHRLSLAIHDEHGDRQDIEYLAQAIPFGGHGCLRLV